MTLSSPVWIFLFRVEPSTFVRYRPTTTHNVEMESWHVTIPYESPFRPRTLRFTIVQCTEGGLGGGEGWAMCRRWVIRGSHLSPEELAVLGPLMVSGGIPELTFEGEL